MKFKTLNLQSQSSDALFAALAAVIGLIIRLAPSLNVSFPLNDGGLFYRMILDLQSNSFRLPVVTTYNSAGIPFAYPPLPFYFTGAIASLFHLDVLVLLRILPPFLSTLSIPAFYFLAKRILSSGPETIFAATLAFAMIPRGFEWQIMGGGITRTFGLLFSLLTIRAAYALFSKRSNQQIIPTVIWGSLTVLTHPEAAAQTVLAAVIFYLVLDRSGKGILRALLCSVGVLTLSSPWWGTILGRDGFDPFIAVIRAARDGTFVDFPARVFLTFQFNFTEESFLPILAMLGLIGFFMQIKRREFLLPLWVTVPLFIEPRSAPQFMVIPLAMLAGIALMELIVPALKSITTSLPASSNAALKGLVAYLFLYTLLSAYLSSMNIAHSVTLQPADRAAFAWVKGNVPPESRFIILTGAGAVTDPVAEWFPALAYRKSLDTIFGLEWVRAVSFRKEIEQYYSLQACLDQGQECLLKWSQATGLQFTHVVIHKSNRQFLLLASLENSPNYVQVYDNQTTSIFEKTP